MTDAIYQFLFSAATISLIAGFFVWLWRRFTRYRSFNTMGRGKVFVREPSSLGRRLFGRAEELATLESALADDAPAVIVGTAGVGKTTLGLALADRARNWERRLVWIGCTPDTDLEAILDRLSLHMKNRYGEDELREAFESTQAHDARQWIDILGDCLRGSRYVFFVDDLYLVQDEIVTTELLSYLVGSTTVIIMTREIAPEVRTALQSAAKQFILQLTGLHKDDAVALLQELGLADESKDLLQQLAHKVAGHPKALEICAGLVKDTIRGLSLQQLLSQSLLGKDPSQPLVKMLETSDRRLSRHERALLVACATFYEPFSSQAVYAVHDSAQSAALLKRLVDRSLVDVDQTGVYSLHPLVREYYQILGRQMVSTRWGAIRLPEPLARWLFRSFLWRRSLIHDFHIQAARYHQQRRQDSLEDESQMVRHLRDALQYRRAAEAEEIILKVQKHPIAIVGHLWILFVAIGFVLGGAYLLLPLVARIGWPWVVWLNARKLLLVISLVSIGTGGWLFLERGMIHNSWIFVTRNRSLTMSHHTWLLPRLLEPRRILPPTPARWLWWYDGVFLDSSTLTVEPARHVFGKMELGYILAHLKQPGQGETVLRLGPIVQPEQRLIEIYQALDIEPPRSETVE